MTMRNPEPTRVKRRFLGFLAGVPFLDRFAWREEPPLLLSMLVDARPPKDGPIVGHDVFLDGLLMHPDEYEPVVEGQPVVFRVATGPSSVVKVIPQRGFPS